MRIPNRIAALAATIALGLAGCHSVTDSTPRPRFGWAEVTMESASGNRTIEGMEAAFYVYSPGPTPDTRAMYLSLGTRDRKPGAFSFELFQFLANGQDIPAIGTFGVREGAIGSDPTMSGDVHFIEDGTLRQFLPAPDAPDSLTIESISLFIDGKSLMSGSFDVTLDESSNQGLHSTRRIHGTFTADRVTRFEDLPTVW